MRILCLTPRLPYPPDRGDRLRAFHILRHLSAEHELTLASFIAQESERELAGSLSDTFRSMHLVPHGFPASVAATALNVGGRAPLQSSFYRSGKMKRLVNRLVAENRFDAAYVHLFRMVQYVEEHPGIYRIVDLTDLISEEISLSLPYRSPFWRVIYSLDLPRIEAYERRVASSLEECWLITEAGRRKLATSCPAANLRVVPNGVDLERFRPSDRKPTADRLVFVGHLSVPHNVDAAVHLVKDILPLVKQSHPRTTVSVVGAAPAPAVRALVDHSDVTVTGFVEDLGEALNEAAVFVAPLRFAAGLQNKVLEAMACGRPVVTTPVVNEGLGARPDEEVVVAEGTENIARRVSQLLDHEGDRTRLGLAGRRFVERTFRWSAAVERVAEIARARSR